MPMPEDIEISKVAPIQSNFYQANERLVVTDRLMLSFEGPHLSVTENQLVGSF